MCCMKPNLPNERPCEWVINVVINVLYEAWVESDKATVHMASILVVVVWLLFIPSGSD